MLTNKTACTLATILIFVTTIAVVHLHGENSRRFAGSVTADVVYSPDKAYLLWQDKKVKGRILLLFDNYPHFVGRINYSGVPELTGSNFVELAIFNNMVRKVFLVIPDSKWPEFRQQDAVTNPIREYTDTEVGVYLFSLNGTPLIALPLSQLPAITEKPLVYINTAVFDYAKVLKQLSQNNISSDCIISLQEVGR